MERLATIGVYGWDIGSFLEALSDGGIEVMADVRQRRGVRGREYSWANAQRLQAALAGAGIAYRHFKEIAPTTELRRLQYAEDDRLGVGKRSRSQLAPEYVERYTEQILDRVDLDEIIAELPRGAVPALLCVERDPEACHRSLVARRMERALGVPVTHLRP